MVRPGGGGPSPGGRFLRPASHNLRLNCSQIIDDTEMIAVKLNSLSVLEPDNIGILTPKSSEILFESIDNAINTYNGITKKGERLGYGRRYYDRWFSKNEVT